MDNSQVKQRLVQLAEGVYVERDVLNIVEKIREYDSNLNVKFCDPNRAEFGDEPYRIVELCPDGLERVVFGCWDLNESVLERIYAADNQKHNVLLDIDGKNLIVKNNEKRRYEDQKLEAMDIVSHYFASSKGRYSFKDSVTEKKITLSDDPNERAKVKE